jgi:hypothetical protein
LIVACAALGGCAAISGPDFEPTPEAAAAPRPALVETASLRTRVAGAGAEAAAFSQATAALEARAAALRARATGLAGPVVDPERRDRLLPAAEPGPESL